MVSAQQIKKSYTTDISAQFCDNVEIYSFS